MDGKIAFGCKGIDAFNAFIFDIACLLTYLVYITI